MLVEPAETSYDLRFRLFGTPVRVHPFFWLFSAIFGWDFLEGPGGFLDLLIWIACCFASILLHEFGHVWMGKVFRSRDSYIVLYSFGGLAVRAGDVWHRWQRIAVSLAGPAIQLAVIYLPLYLWLDRAPAAFRGLGTHVRAAVIMLMYVNLYWPLFNLLPVWPLDGGKVSREVCTWLSPRGGLRFSLGLSVAVAAVIAVHALLAQGRGTAVIPYLPTDLYAAILFAMLAFGSWQLLQMTPRQPSYEADDRLPWESDPDAWKRR